MTFKQPKNITFTEMAQWIDSNSYKQDRDNDKFVEYLYHVSYIKAERANLFNNYDTYDDFAIFCVSKLYTRYGNTKAEPVKSIVNYLKIVLAHWKSEYIREFCSGEADLLVADFDVTEFSDYLIDVASEYDYNSYSFVCFKITDVLKKHLSRIPVRKNSCEWSNIYTSCLLTLNHRLKLADAIKRNAKKQDAISIHRQLREIKQEEPILFHLSDKNSNYINTLVNELIHALSTEIQHVTHFPVSASTCLQNMVKAAFNEEED